MCLGVPDFWGVWIWRPNFTRLNGTQFPNPTHVGRDVAPRTHEERWLLPRTHDRMRDSRRGPRAWAASDPSSGYKLHESVRSLPIICSIDVSYRGIDVSYVLCREHGVLHRTR